MSVNDPDWVEQGDESEDVYDQLVDRDPLRLRDRCREAERELADLRASIAAEADACQEGSQVYDGDQVARILLALLVVE